MPTDPHKFKSQYRSRETLRKKIGKIAKEKSFNNITEFINAWIQKGETFKSLQESLQLEYDIICLPQEIWLLLRNYLTIPYGYEDQFWYRWDAIAKVKGFENAYQMAQNFKRKKLCLREIAEELGTHIGYAHKLMRRLSQIRINGQIVPKRTYTKRNRWEKTKDRNGFSQQSCRDKWKEKLTQFGFKSFREAVWKLRREKLSYREMAKLFGISERLFLYRRRRAGI